MLTWLLLLTPVIALAVIVWTYRRKMAAREAASSERLKEILSKVPADGAANDPRPAPFSAAAPASTSRASTPSRPPLDFALRERVLTPPQSVLYYLLKSNLPDHEVFAQVSVAAFIDVPAAVSGFEREARQRRLAAAVADFVVCDKSFKVVAAVQCGAREGNAADVAAFARACCESVSLRWVEVMPDALPKREAIRSIVLGV